MRFSGWVLLLVMAGLSACQTEPEAASLFEVKITNGGPDTVRNYCFAVDLPRLDTPYHLVTGNIPVPFQLEDRNANGIPDKLYGQLDLLPASIYTVTAQRGANSTSPSSLVTAEASLSGAQHPFHSYGYNDQDNWPHGGVILENEYGAYRLMMKYPFAIDVLGKRNTDLVLPATDEQGILEDLVDLIDEGLSLGAGRPAICLIDEIYDLGTFDSLQLNLVSNGPLRAELETILRGVPVRDDKLDIQATYILEAGQPWMDIQVKLLSKTNLNIQFAFGLPKNADATPFTQGKRDRVHFAYTYGLQSALGDHLGLAILVQDRFNIENFLAHPENSFYLADTRDQTLEYRVIYAWSGDHRAIADEVQFLNLVKRLASEYNHLPSVKANFQQSTY